MYLQHPSLFENKLAFVHQDAIWLTDLTGTNPHRLTAPLSSLSSLSFNPSGSQLAFSAAYDLWIISTYGGMAEQITYLGKYLKVVTWRDEKTIIVASDHQGILGQIHLFSVDLETKNMTKITNGHIHPLGPAQFLSYGPGQSCVLQVDGYGYESFKGYKGGLAGKLWVDTQGTGQFKRLLPNILHNLLRPLWIGDRIFFLSDFQGHGNIYSCTPQGEDLRRHTSHKDFYVCQSTSHKNTLAYSAGGKLHIFKDGTSTPLTIHVPEGPLSRHEVKHDASKNLKQFSLSPNGTQLSLICRGQLFKATVHKGPVLQCGEDPSLRYQLADWMHNGHMLAVHDEGLKEVWHELEKDTQKLHVHSFEKDIGQTTSFKVNPKNPWVLSINHRHEIFWLNFETKEAILLDKSRYQAPQGYNWSPCGRWAVYSLATQYHGASLWLYDTKTQEKSLLMNDNYRNKDPIFDAKGKFIFFISARNFSPQWDSLGMQMVCQAPFKLYALLLKKNEPSPFLAPFLKDCAMGASDSLEDKKQDNKAEGQEETKQDSEKQEEKKDDIKKDEKKDKLIETLIDIEGIQQRLVPFPLEPQIYSGLFSLDNQLLYATISESKKKSLLWSYDFKTLKTQVILKDFDEISFSLDRSMMAYSLQKRLRVVQAGVAPGDSSDDTSYQQGGWFDWNRIHLSTSPRQEWNHMFDEAWRLQKEMFWTAEMASIDWQNVYDRYKKSLETVRSRSELIALLYDMQGELRTSHAYIQTPAPDELPLYPASLGADLVYDLAHGAYRIDKIIPGDGTNDHPLLRPGLDLKEGDLIWAIGGQNLSVDRRPETCLLGQEGQAVVLTVGVDKKNVIVFPLSPKEERVLRYRTWVENNRQWVHSQSQGDVGYIHIPDMGAKGFGEFMRSYVQEFDRKGLIVDARYNGGGNISYLILDLLKRRRLGYDYSRHEGIIPYPSWSPRGPMVALINGATGSDGDIFAYSFKDMKLGPVVGKRSWGGVVGISPRHNLIDGTTTTQPEYAFWFYKAGWNVENYGVDPDIEIEHAPQDVGDAQMQKALDIVFAQIQKEEPMRIQERTPPSFPNLSPSFMEDSEGSDQGEKGWDHVRE